MAEILTESFCERCGTGYTFETPVGPSGRLSSVRVLGKGLKKLALTRAGSLDEALDLARADQEREAAERQIEAFKDVFHLCLSCRQYTCSSCWNEDAGRCLSCAPTPESEAAERAQAEAEAADRARAEQAAAAAAAEVARLRAEREAAARAQAEAEAAARERVAQALTRRRGGDRAAATDATDASQVEGLAAEPRVAAEPASLASDEPATSPATSMDSPATAPSPTKAGPAARPSGRLRGRLGRRGTDVDPRPLAERTEPAATDATEMDGPGLPAGPLLAAFEPGTSLDDAIAAYEAALDPGTTGTLPSSRDVVETLVGEPTLGPADAAADGAEQLAGERSGAQPEPGLEDAPGPADETLLEAAAELPQDVALEDRLIRQAVEAALAQPLSREPFAGAASDDDDAWIEASTQRAASPASLDPAPAAQDAPELAPAAELTPEPLPAVSPIEPAEPVGEAWAPRPPETPPPPAAPFGAWPTAASPADRPARPAVPSPPDDGLTSPAGEDPRLAAWRIVAPETAAPQPGWRRVASPSETPAVLAGAARGAAPAGARGRPDAPGQASAAQACVKCGLSLSATARFCRRCGTRQG